MAAAELIDAVKALRLENPEIGVKKIAASVKARGLGGAKEVRQALADIKAAEDSSSAPAVSPSKSPVKASEAESTPVAPAETARQQKMRERQEAAAAAAAERKAREKRKRNAFSKLFPDLDVQAAFGPGVDRRVQEKAKKEIQAKLTDQSYVTSAVLEGRLSPQEIQELVEDMKAGGFTPSLSESDDEDDICGLGGGYGEMVLAGDRARGRVAAGAKAGSGPMEAFEAARWVSGSCVLDC